MKTLNGLLFIVIGGLIIWVGATGRLPALAAALGMIRSAPGNQKSSESSPQFADVTGGSSSTFPGATPGIIGLTPKGQDVWKSLQGPALGPWKEVLGLQ